MGCGRLGTRLDLQLRSRKFYLPISSNSIHRIVGKFDGESELGSLAVGVETTKLKSANIISPATRNDICMH